MRRPARTSVLVAWSIALGSLIAGASAVPADPPASRGPVEAALGLDGGGSGASEALDRRRAAEIARRTTECMAEAGFDFVAEPDPPPPIPDGDLDPTAWAQRWGFGISTSVGAATLAEAPAGPAPTTIAARQALYGRPEEPGCHDRARAEVQGLRDRLLAPLAAALAGLQATIDADPAMVAVLADWRRCAEAASGVEDIERASFGRIVLDAFATRTAAVRGAGDLERLQVEERRVAAALAVCELGYVRGHATVARVHEAAFVAVHGPGLAAVGAAIQAAEAAYPPDPGP